MFCTALKRPSLRHARRGVVVVLCLTLGLQWALLQGIAWTQMFIDFANEGSVIEAVEKTFDGKHGCALCAKVKEGRQEASGKQTQQEDDNERCLDAVLVGHPILVPPSGEAMSFAPRNEMLTGRKEMPDPPPPRRGLV